MSKNFSNKDNKSATELFSHNVSNPVATDDEVMDAILRYQQCGLLDSIDYLRHTNMRFVVIFAKQHTRNGLVLEKLFVAGDKGMELAAKRHDATRDGWSKSYAVWGIRQSILQTILYTYNEKPLCKRYLN